MKRGFSFGAWLFIAIILSFGALCCVVLYSEVFGRGIDRDLGYWFPEKGPEYGNTKIVIIPATKKQKSWFEDT